MNNRIHASDHIQVQILTPDGQTADTMLSSGFNNVEEAVDAAYRGSEHATADCRDYVYVVSDLTTGTSEQYRYNAHSHLKLIPRPR
ncbi:MAG: hypothetical protein J6C77_01380 [Muribaculaceae bacterium]|nr:hypothetical protein [Muribaculaceae bacterium]